MICKQKMRGRAPQRGTGVASLLAYSSHTSGIVIVVSTVIVFKHVESAAACPSALPDDT